MYTICYLLYYHVLHSNPPVLSSIYLYKHIYIYTLTPIYIYPYIHTYTYRMTAAEAATDYLVVRWDGEAIPYIPGGTGGNPLQAVVGVGSLAAAATAAKSASSAKSTTKPAATAAALSPSTGTESIKATLSKQWDKLGLPDLTLHPQPPHYSAVHCSGSAIEGLRWV
jgi:hypothetical protein